MGPPRSPPAKPLPAIGRAPDPFGVEKHSAIAQRIGFDEASKDSSTTFFLGRYRVISEIGRGGMASVHLGRVDGPGGFHKWVAIKQIHAHLLDNDQFVDMFLDEARMAAGINHANVAQVFDIGKEGESYWIVMEYLHGEPLRELMRHQEEGIGAPVLPQVAARICADAAEGLHAAHELTGKNGEPLGLVHRDVTPHNLFVTYDGYTKVVDFGIARATGRLSTTTHGQLKGKIAYMSPEQVRNLELDRRTDVYALGIVLWELSTNHRLFRMENDLDTLEKVFAGDVPRPSTIVRGYPMELEQIVLRALAVDREKRYQTAREFSRDLHRFLAHAQAFVAWEDVSIAMKRAFSSAIQKRDAHLAWATDLTNTIQAPVALPRSDRVPRSEVEDDLVGEDDEDATIARDDDPFKSVPPPPMNALGSTSGVTMDADDEALETVVHDRPGLHDVAAPLEAKRGPLPSLEEPTQVIHGSSRPPPLPKPLPKAPARPSRAQPAGASTSSTGGATRKKGLAHVAEKTSRGELRAARPGREAPPPKARLPMTPEIAADLTAVMPTDIEADALSPPEPPAPPVIPPPPGVPASIVPPSLVETQLSANRHAALANRRVVIFLGSLAAGLFVLLVYTLMSR